MIAALQSSAQEATSRVAELRATVWKWLQEESSARDSAAATRRELESASLSDEGQAYGLMEAIERAEARAAAAASLAASARRQLQVAEDAATGERAREQQAEAGRLWKAWREHQTRTGELLRELPRARGSRLHGARAHRGRPHARRRSGCR